MNKKTIEKMLETLDKWVSPGMFLEYGNAWQLLFATILSAQCTDERVNIATVQKLYDYVLAILKAI